MDAKVTKSVGKKPWLAPYSGLLVPTSKARKDGSLAITYRYGKRIAFRHKVYHHPGSGMPILHVLLTNNEVVSSMKSEM